MLKGCHQIPALQRDHPIHHNRACVEDAKSGRAKPLTRFPVVTKPTEHQTYLPEANVKVRKTSNTHSHWSPDINEQK